MGERPASAGWYVTKPGARSRTSRLTPAVRRAHERHAVPAGSGQPRTRTPPLRRKTISTSLRPKAKTIRSRTHFLTFTLAQPDGNVKQTLTGHCVNGCSSTTLCVPHVGWNEQANSLTVSGRAGSTGTTLPGSGTGCAGGAISSGTPGGGWTSTGGGGASVWMMVRCTGTTTGGPPTRIRTGPPRMMTSARASAAANAATTTRANALLMLLLLRTSGWCGWVAVVARTWRISLNSVLIGLWANFAGRAVELHRPVVARDQGRLGGIAETEAAALPRHETVHYTGFAVTVGGPHDPQALDRRRLHAGTDTH